MLFRRLTREQDWARQPVLADAQLQRLITTYLPANEKRSTRRYVADMTYVFNPEAVARLLQSSGIAYAAAQAKRVLLIPMAPGYSRGSPWTAALSNPRFANSMVPFSVPVGDALDMNALGALSFDTANWTDVEPAASRIHASEAVLVQAVVTGNKMTITLHRLGAGEMPTKVSVQIPVLQGAASTYPAAADAAVRALEDLWKSHTAVDFSQKSKLVVDVQIGSLAQLANLQNTLAGVPNVSSVTIVAMDIAGARLSLTYIGTLDQLRRGAGAGGLGADQSRWGVAARRKGRRGKRRRAVNALLRQVPNILSALRLFAAPVAAYLILHKIAVAALCVFVFAGLTDALDGFLAKQFALTSRFGAWLDPAADKLLMLASYVALTVVGAVPPWLTALVIGRDIAIVAGVGLARLLEAPLRITPLTIGKVSTVVQVLFVALVLRRSGRDLAWRDLFRNAGGSGFHGSLVFFLRTMCGLQAVAARRRAA